MLQPMKLTSKVFTHHLSLFFLSGGAPQKNEKKGNPRFSATANWCDHREAASNMRVNVRFLGPLTSKLKNAAAICPDQLPAGNARVPDNYVRELNFIVHYVAQPGICRHHFRRNHEVFVEETICVP